MRLCSTFFPAVLGLYACTSSACGQDEPSPVDLEWLRGECAGGALVHHADGRLYLTELASGQSEFLANGNQPEFSPDGARLAWIDGTRAKGRLRGGDPTVYVIAKNVEAAGGVHWLSNGDVALVVERGGSKRWFRVGLDGSRREIPELTALGLGGYECDVKRASDGVWSYVADQSWATSDGRSGKVPGTCSVSLSPDGATVTSLHNPHKRADLTAIRPGGTTQPLMWPFAGGFDNHRFATSDPRFLVTVDEHTQTMVVMTVDGQRCTRVGTLGRAKHGMYGDWTSLPPTDADWIPVEARADEETDADGDSPGGWPQSREEAVFLWDSARSSNTLTSREPADSLCRLELQGQARWGGYFELVLDGGRAVAEERSIELALEDFSRSGEGAVEFVIWAGRDDSRTQATILELSGALEFVQEGRRLRARVRLEGGDAATIDFGDVVRRVPDHLALTWDGADLTAYRNGREVDRASQGGALAWDSSASALTVGASADGSRDWTGSAEGIAIYRAALDPSEVRAHFAARRGRLAARPLIERREVVAILERKRALPRPELYPNTLVVYDYAVEGDQLSVAHWAILSGEVQAAVRDRRVSSTYRLRLEPWSEHAELHRFKLTGSEDVAGALWFDATSPAAAAAAE